MFTSANNPKEAVNDLKAGARRAKDEVKNTAYDVQDSLASAAHDTGRKLRSIVDSAGEEFSHATDTVKTQINSNPVQSSVIALLAGFFLGSILRR